MQEAIEIKSRNQTLRGMLHIPDQADGKIPVIIILHGFGGNKMGPHFMFVKLSRLLEELGFASIRVDFAGSGESDGEFINMTLSGELEDAENILLYAKSLKFADTERIGVVGFSMGGAVASMLAGKHRDEIKALSLWAPAGNMAEIVINDFIGKAYGDFLKAGYHEFEGVTIGKSFVEDIQSLDIYHTASAYNGKVLLLHGDADEVVHLSASKRYLKNYGEKASLTVIDGADHLFTQQAWKQQMLRQTLKFFREHLHNESLPVAI